MEKYKWLRRNIANANKKTREAMKLIDRAMFPYPSTANKERAALANKYLDGDINVHMLRQQINMKGLLVRISPPVSPKRPKQGTSPIKIPIKKKTRK